MALCGCIAAANLMIDDSEPDYTLCECAAGLKEDWECVTDYVPSDPESIFNDFLTGPIPTEFLASYGLEMPSAAMIYEQLSNLRGPPCSHMIENCLWKE